MLNTQDITDRPGARYPDLTGKVAVVTGGSRGIGAGVASALAAQGVRVAVVGRDRAALDEVVARITSEGGFAVAVRADLTVEADVERLVGDVHERLGLADVVVAFAGGGGAGVPTAQESLSHWHDVLNCNLSATFLTVWAFLDDLVERRGAVVTMSSESGRQPTRASAAYAAAKGGVIAFSRHLAGELAPQGVRVNCLAPATVENDAIRAYVGEQQRQQMDASMPLGRIGQPADIANAVLFLASDASSWTTGVTLDLTGGRTIL